MPEYSSWRQVAGYFDGDGTIAFSDTSNQPYKLGFSLGFVDQSEDQMKMLKRFFEKHGVVTRNVPEDLKRNGLHACG